MLLRAQQWKGEEALLGIRATLSEGVFMATLSKGYAVRYRSLKPLRASHTLGTLSEIAGDGLNK